MSGVFIQHVNDIMTSGGNPTDIALIDFTVAFNMHSFIEWFIIKYGDELDLEGSPEIKEVFRNEWNKHFDEVVNPLYQKGLGFRKTIMGVKKKEKERDITEADYFA